MAIKSYKITLQQQITLLAHAIITTLGLIVIYLYFFKGSLTDREFWIVFTFFLFFDILPSIALHIQYLIKNFGATLIIDTGAQKLMYEDKRKKIVYAFNDIVFLKYYRSYGKGAGVQSFSMYRYYKIVFKDNSELNITCLMINDIEDTLEVLLRMTPEKHFQLLNLIESQHS